MPRSLRAPRADSALVRRRLALAAFVLLAGCRGAPAPTDTVFFDLREFASSSGEGTPGAEAAPGAPDERLQLSSRQRIYLGAEPLRVDAFTRWRAPDGESLESQSVTYWDRDARRVWTGRGDAGLTWRSFAAIDYEAANRRRLATIVLWEACARRPEVRAMEDLEFYFGDGRRRDSGVTYYAGSRLSLRRLAIEPGVYWDAAVLTGDVTPFDSEEARLEFLVGVLGVAPGRAARVLRWLGGVPLVIDIHYFPGVEGATRLEGELYDLGSARPEPPSHEPPVGGGEAPEGDPYALEPRALLGRVSELDGLSSPETNATEIFLALSQGLDRDTFADAVRLFGAVRESWVRVELARALIRYDGPGAWRALARYLDPAVGVAALDVVEAGIAEARPEAASALLDLLRRRDEFAPTLAPAVTAWGLGHVRVLSGMTLARFLERFPAAGASDDEAELELWLEWWAERDILSGGA